jgi:hypothetical protein
MGKLSGTVLILAGVSLAAYTLSAQQEAGTTRATRTAETTAPATPPAAPAASAPTAAPAPPASPAIPTPPPRAESPPVASPPAAPPRSVAPQKLRAGGPVAVRVTEAPLRMPVGETAATASPPLDRPALTREIQRQLKRIGCYQGEASGVWSPPVRQAVKAVTDRVNASLPTDQPDPVLLAMVQSQEPGTCGTTCPKGQSRAADGRCLPAALVATAGKQRTPTAAAEPGSAQRGVQTGVPKGGGKLIKAAPPAAAVEVAAEGAAAESQLDGRMSLAGPKAEMPRQAKARSQRSRAAPAAPRAAAQAHRQPGHRARQRSAQRSGPQFWAFPFLLP